MSFNTHVYVTVRVKVIGTNFSADPQEVAGKVADAISGDANGWLRYRERYITIGGQKFDIEDLQYADQITGVLVDRIDPVTDEVVAEHTFDEAISPVVRHERLFEEELADFLCESIEDRDIELGDITKLMARYGLMEPQAFSAEMRERMEVKAKEGAAAVVSPEPAKNS